MKRFKIAIGIVVGIMVVFAAVQVINAGKYDMVVNVVDGENVLGLNPTDKRLDFGDLSRNNRMVRQIAVANGGAMNSFVIVWKFGELAELVQVDKNFFRVAPGQESKVSLEMKIPPSAQTRKYEGNVWVFRIPKPI